MCPKPDQFGQEGYLIPKFQDLSEIVHETMDEYADMRNKAQLEARMQRTWNRIQDQKKLKGEMKRVIESEGGIHFDGLDDLRRTRRDNVIKRKLLKIN